MILLAYHCCLFACGEVKALCSSGDNNWQMAHINAIRQTSLLTTALLSKCPVLEVVVVVAVLVVSLLAVLPPCRDLHLTISSPSPFSAHRCSKCFCSLWAHIELAVINVITVFSVPQCL